MILGLQLVLSQGLSLALVDLHLLALLSPRVSMPVARPPEVTQATELLHKAYNVCRTQSLVMLLHDGWTR